ncbi:neutral amino acid permease protein [Colletotrichum camelliae]|nr:neutral amino acid permease protein [Colletotrichum camelliae]
MEARDMIIRTLGQNTNGSYALLEHKLDRVSRQLKMGASFEQLEAALDESSSSCDVAIKDLQQTLPADHISQLNELLKSLITLDRIIENRYSSVLRIDNGYVYAQEGVQEYLEAKSSSSQRARTKDNGTISMTITINDVDPDQCGSFFWDLAELAVRDKFQFSLQGSNQRTTAIDEFRAHHEIVIRAFEYLRSNPKEETKEIGLYLLRRLPYHLGRLYTLDNEDGGRELKRQEKAQIEKHLFETFKDQTILHRHKSILEQLVWSSSDMASVWEWLKDPAVLRNLDQMWCNEIRATHPPRGFLRELVLMVVQRFLKERTWDVSNASLWIREFMAADDQYNSRRLHALSEKRPKIKNVSSESLSELSGSNNIDWDEVGSWCQDILGLTLSGTNSLWYERLAEASSIQGDSLSSTIKLYEKSISQRNPSWLCFKGLGNAYYSQDRHEEAIETIQRALEETEQEGSEPEPNIQDIAELHLILGNCAYECGDIPLAVEHYASACSAEKTNQAFQAHLGHLKAKLRMPDVDIKQLLKTTIGDELEDERNIGVLQMMARDSEDDELMLIILAVAKQDAELLESVIRVLQKAVDRLVPLDRHGTETFLTSDTYDAGLIRGVLLYHLGVAIYTHENDAVENHKSVSEAVALLSDSRDQLAKLGGSNASIIGSQATSKLAKHYFQENRVEELTKLAEDNSRDYYNHPARLLGALYAQQGNKEESRRWLQRHVQRGLLNLSDDFDDNDLHGLYLVVTAMLQHRDFNNAVVAFSLQSEADLVTAALCFDLEDIEVENEDDKQRVLDVLERLAEETVHATRLRVPDSARQLDRIDAAKEYIECLTGGSSGETKSEGEAKGDPDVATTAAHNLIHTRITDLKASHSPGLSPTAFRSRWCDGRTSDGKG